MLIIKINNDYENYSGSILISLESMTWYLHEVTAAKSKFYDVKTNTGFPLNTYRKKNTIYFALYSFPRISLTAVKTKKIRFFTEIP